MSYSVNSQCWNCKKKERCMDLEKIQEAVARIHTKTYEQGHQGSGTIIHQCTRQEAVNKSETIMDFSKALVEVKQGKAISREGWNGKGLKVKAQIPDTHSKMTLPYLYIEYPDGKRCPWAASQTDLMASDWMAE